MMSVELRARVCGGYVVVLRGELDSADAESTASAVAELAEDGQQLIIDLEALEYIDCHALSGLLRARYTVGGGARYARELPVRTPPKPRD